jgi:hypothetical protein
MMAKAPPFAKALSLPDALDLHRPPAPPVADLLRHGILAAL